MFTQFKITRTKGYSDKQYFCHFQVKSKAMPVLFSALVKEKLLLFLFRGVGCAQDSKISSQKCILSKNASFIKNMNNKRFLALKPKELYFR